MTGKDTKVMTKERKSIAWILISILLFLGICTVYSSAYSCFVSVKYGKETSKKEVYLRDSDTSVYEKIAATGMNFNRKQGLISSHRSLYRNNFREIRALVSENKLSVSQLFYFITISMLFSPLFHQVQGILNYIHKQDGEK